MKKKETFLGRDKTLESLPVNERLKELVDTTKKEAQGIDNTEFEKKVLQLATNQVVVPKTIKLIQEYESSVGKDKSLIPEEHSGMISYGTITQTGEFSSLYQWEAMIIGPQEVFLLFIKLFFWILTRFYLPITLVSNWSSYLYVVSKYSQGLSSKCT